MAFDRFVSPGKVRIQRRAILVTWYRGLEHVVREGEPMAPWNWLRVGGAAEYFAEPTSIDELAELARRCYAEQRSMRILGAGSNVLVHDAGIRGLVVHLSAPPFCQIDIDKHSIRAGSGAKLNHVVATAAREGLAGLETFVGIPGTVGGAARGNSVGHGSSIGQWIDAALVMNRQGEIIRLGRAELQFGHHQSNLDNYFILELTFVLEPGDPSHLTRQMQKRWIVRRASQPTGELGNCKTFADPRGMTASEIIEQAGLRGMRVGNALLSDRDPNFIEVRPGARSEDVKGLIEQVRTQVLEKLGVDLVPQIEFWT